MKERWGKTVLIEIGGKRTYQSLYKKTHILQFDKETKKRTMITTKTVIVEKHPNPQFYSLIQDTQITPVVD